MVGEEDDLKGMIPYPCCKAQKAMVYMSAHGQSSHKCPRCGKVTVFDYDKMIAWTARPIRGATHKFTRQ